VLSVQLLRHDQVGCFEQDYEVRRPLLQSEELLFVVGAARLSATGVGLRSRCLGRHQTCLSASASSDTAHILTL